MLIEHQVDESQYEIVEVLNPGEEVPEEYVQVPTDSELQALESGIHSVTEHEEQTDAHVVCQLPSKL
jgi:hypothetical protein